MAKSVIGVMYSAKLLAINPNDAAAACTITFAFKASSIAMSSMLQAIVKGGSNGAKLLNTAEDKLQGFRKNFGRYSILACGQQLRGSERVLHSPIKPVLQQSILTTTQRRKHS
jgi:hypothetical protein